MRQVEVTKMGKQQQMEIEEYVAKMVDQLEMPYKEVLKQECSFPDDVKSYSGSEGLGEWCFGDPLRAIWELQFLSKIRSLQKQKSSKVQLWQMMLEIGALVLGWAVVGKMASLDFFQISLLSLVSVGVLQIAQLQMRSQIEELGKAKMLADVDHMCFSCTAAGGNLCKILMKLGEKLTYIECRMMCFFWEDREIIRHLGQVLCKWSSKDELKEGSQQLFRSWVAARRRCGDCQEQDLAKAWARLWSSALESEMASTKRFLEEGTAAGRSAEDMAYCQVHESLLQELHMEMSWEAVQASGENI